MDKEKTDVIMSAFVLISNLIFFFLAHYNIVDKELIYTLFVIQTFLYSFKEFSSAWITYVEKYDKEAWKKAQQILGKDLTEKALKNVKK